MTKLIKAQVADHQAWVTSVAQAHLRKLGVLILVILAFAVADSFIEASPAVGAVGVSLMELWRTASTAWERKSWQPLGIEAGYFVGLATAAVGLAAMRQALSVFRNIDRSLEQSRVALLAATVLMLPVGYEALRLVSLGTGAMGGALFAMAVVMVVTAVRHVKAAKPRLQGACLIAVGFGFIMAGGVDVSMQATSNASFFAMLAMACVLIVGLRMDAARERREEQLRYWLSIGGDYLGKKVLVSEWLDKEALRISMYPDLLEVLMPYRGRCGRVLAIEPDDRRPTMHIEFGEGAEQVVVVTSVFNRTWLQICEE